MFGSSENLLILPASSQIWVPNPSYKYPFPPSTTLDPLHVIFNIWRILVSMQNLDKQTPSFEFAESRPESRGEERRPQQQQQQHQQQQHQQQQQQHQHHNAAAAAAAAAPKMITPRTNHQFDAKSTWAMHSPKRQQIVASGNDIKPYLAFPRRCLWDHRWAIWHLALIPNHT